jgi:hypothetical protein
LAQPNTEPSPVVSRAGWSKVSVRGRGSQHEHGVAQVRRAGGHGDRDQQECQQQRLLPRERRQAERGSKGDGSCGARSLAQPQGGEDHQDDQRPVQRLAEAERVVHNQWQVHRGEPGADQPSALTGQAAACEADARHRPGATKPADGLMRLSSVGAQLAGHGQDERKQR